MELTETIDSINRQLKDLYGIDTSSAKQMWRVVLANDQWEWRMSTHTLEGLELMRPQVLWMPKYPWLKGMYVLEQLTIVPDVNREELPEHIVDYNIVYSFTDKNLNYLPPRLDAARFVISLIQAAQGKGHVKVYKDPEAGLSKQDLLEQKDSRLKDLQNELYGDESGLEGKTHLTGEAIVVPPNYKVN